jgi:hypothetical protein
VNMHFEGDAHVPLLFISMAAPAKRGANTYECDRCHAIVFEGDWPWCGGKPEGHQRAK